MRYFMYIVISVSMLATYISSPAVHLAPGVVKFLPDAVSALLIVYILAEGARQQFRNVGVKYWLIFGALILTMVCGPLVNQEDVGPVIAGVRYYVRAIPLFFVPAVFKFSERDIGKYLKFILALSLLQVPLEIYQRATGVSLGLYTGDLVIGTLMESGHLTIFLISAMCVMSALMLRGRMSKLWFVPCFVLMVIGVSINETKVTFFLLPLCLLATFVIASPPKRRLLVTFQALAVLTIFGAIFVPVYDALSFKGDGSKDASIEDFFTDSSSVNRYLNTNAGVGTGKEAGRGDAIRAPFAALSGDPIKLTFGLGVGSVSKSSLGEQYSGHYSRLYWNFALWSSVVTFLFEIGLLATCLVFLLQWMILRDALFLAKHDESLMGTVAMGYVGVWIAIVVGLFYIDLHINESISYSYWFFSGLIAARRQRLVLARSAVVSGARARRAPALGKSSSVAG